MPTDDRVRTIDGPERNLYSIEIRENDKLLNKHPMADPFHTTKVHVRGWRNAWEVLRGRYHVEVSVGGDRDHIEKVMELDPDYLGPPGSKSRERWNKELDAALYDFADRISDDGSELAPPKEGPLDE